MPKLSPSFSMFASFTIKKPKIESFKEKERKQLSPLELNAEIIDSILKVTLEIMDVPEFKKVNS